MSGLIGTMLKGAIFPGMAGADAAKGMAGGMGGGFDWQQYAKPQQNQPALNPMNSLGSMMGMVNSLGQQDYDNPIQMPGMPGGMQGQSMMPNQTMPGGPIQPMNMDDPRRRSLMGYF